MTKAYCHMGEEDNAVIYGLNCQISCRILLYCYSWKGKEKMTKLIAKAKNGNKKAMEKIYELTSSELFCYCQQLCGNEHDAQDLFQDTYLTAFEKLDQYRRDENFKGWLHTIALHKYYNKLRAEKPQLRVDEPNETVAEEGELYAPESYSERAEIQRIITEIIAKNLSEPQRLTVVLYYYDEMSVGDIAKELDCPEGTVKTRLYHSRKILKDELVKRGITLGGTTVLVSALLKAHASAFTVSAATSTIMNNIIGKSTASRSLKSIFAYTKSKIIIGATAVTVAGGSVGIYHIVNNDEKASAIPKHSTSAKITVPTAAVPAIVKTTTVQQVTTKPVAELTTGVSEPGGEPVEYTFDSNHMKVFIPENYTPSNFFKSKNADDSYSLTSLKIRESDLENRRFWSMHNKEVLKFRPDTFSGDEVIFMTRLEEFEKIDILSELSFFYDNVSVSEPQQIIISVDNTNSPESPNEKTAKRCSFTANSNMGNISGIIILFNSNVNDSHVIIFSDCSGIRQQEYENIISSISLDYIDNSWKDKYDIPDTMR